MDDKQFFGVLGEPGDVFGGDFSGGHTDNGSVGTSQPVPDGIDELAAELSDSLDKLPDVNVGRFRKAKQMPSLVFSHEHGAESSCLRRNDVEKTHSRAGYQQAILDAQWNNTSLTSLKLPWEQGVMSSIFGSNDISTSMRVEPVVTIAGVSKLHGCEDEPYVVEPGGFSSDQPVYELAIRGGRGFRVDHYDNRELGLRKWLCVLYQNLSHSGPGLEIALVNTEQEALGILSDALGGKSNSTINKRANCMQRFVTWSMETFGTGVVIPIQHDRVVRYLRHLRGIGKHSSISEFVETLGFAKFVLCIQVNFDLASSAVIKGIVREAKQNRREVVQSRPLTAQEVLALETALIEKRGNKLDRYAIGVFLFQIYARARVSDIRNVTSIIIDITDNFGYIEVKTSDHKGKRLTGVLGLALLLIAPITGLHSLSWGHAFIEVANEVGFDFKSGHKGPLLPAVGLAGEWLSRPVSTDETTDWLNMLITKCMATECKAGLTSHGLKATVLSWMAKLGAHDDTRLILGHHSLRGKTSLESYSRDMQAAPLREMSKCIEMIKNHQFLPDATRSGQMPADRGREQPGHTFVSQAGRNDVISEAAPHAETKSETIEILSDESGALSDPADSWTRINMERVPESESSSDSSSDDTSDSGSAVEREAASAGIDRIRPSVVWRANCHVYQHVRTKTLHLKAHGSGTDILVCGRHLGKDMKDVTGKVSVMSFNKCKQCNAGRPIKDVGSLAELLDTCSKKRREQA